jgi:prepilin-type N-terminal cleavage/methylation domain-containing protein
MPHRAAARAFTLIELLVVISIIALLIGILLPALGSARESSKQTTCMSNVRQMSLATNAYLVDHRDATPHAASNNRNGGAVNGPWGTSVGQALKSYLGGDPQQIYRCPSASDSPDDAWVFQGDDPLGGGPGTGNSWVPNYFYMATGSWITLASNTNWYPQVWSTRNAANLNLAQVAQSPSQVLLWVDESTSHHTRTTDIYNRNAEAAPNTTDISHFGYADGHVERKKFENLGGYLALLGEPIPQTQFGVRFNQSAHWPITNDLP